MTIDSSTAAQEVTLRLEMTFTTFEKDALVRAQSILLARHIDEDVFSYNERTAIVELVEHVGWALR
jgi:hypothetical protein